MDYVGLAGVFPTASILARLLLCRLLILRSAAGRRAVLLSKYEGADRVLLGLLHSIKHKGTWHLGSAESLFYAVSSELRGRKDWLTVEYNQHINKLGGHRAFLK